MSELFQVILATFVISLGALVGVVTLALNHKRLQQILLTLVSLSAGTLMGGAFLHLLPEAAEHIEPETLFPTVLLAFVGFFVIEKFLHWHHCHREDCEVHTVGYMNLIGDSIHNFLDGVIIAAAFSQDITLGVVTTIAVALHEIPQEISDFGVLLHAGWEKQKALLANFGVALFVVLGGIVGVYLAAEAEELAEMLLPVAAGGFIYIAASDLLPIIRREKNQRKAWINFGVFLLGIALMYALTFMEVGH